MGTSVNVSNRNASFLLQDLETPLELNRKKMTPTDVRRWKVVVGTLMKEGVLTPYRISKLTGLTLPAAEDFVQNIRKHWSRALKATEINFRREELYQECERIKRRCWDLFEYAVEDREKRAYLQMVLDAGKRQATLCGMDKINMELITEVKHKDEQDMISEGHTLSFTVEQFAAIGDAISSKITQERHEDDDAR